MAHVRRALQQGAHRTECSVEVYVDAYSRGDVSPCTVQVEDRNKSGGDAMTTPSIQEASVRSAGRVTPMPDTTLSEDLGRLLDHFAGRGPNHPPQLSLVGQWVRSATDLEDQVRRLTAERDAAVAQAQASGEEVGSWRGIAEQCRESRSEAIRLLNQAETDRDTETERADRNVNLLGAATEEGRVLREALEGICRARTVECAHCIAHARATQCAIDAALATPPTAHAKLAEARREYIAANRHYLRVVANASDQREVAAAQERRRLADENLRDAEREAGVGERG